MIKIVFIFICIFIYLFYRKYQVLNNTNNNNNIIIQEGYSNKEYYCIETKLGLCNRLRNLFSHYLYCKNNNKTLLVLWDTNQDCEGHFLDYFKPLNNVIFINSKYELKKYNHLNVDYKGNEWHKDYCPYDMYVYEDLKLNDGIQRKVNLVKEKLGDYISVHIRRSDHSQLAKKHNKYTDDNVFIDFIKSNKDNVYLATDCKKTQKKFKELFPERIFINKDLKETNNKRKTNMEDAIIDIFVCSDAKKFQGSGFSSFSGVIKQINNNKNKKK